jgi:hypothetical protein
MDKITEIQGGGEMSEKCYSTNNEDFNYTDLDEVIEEAFNDPYAIVGHVVTVFEGDSVKKQAGNFANFWPIDRLKECVYDECGEYAEDWLDNCTKEQEADLEDRIKEVVNKWADDYGLQPTFYGVKNVKEIKVELLDTEGNYKILSEEATCRPEK